MPEKITLSRTEFYAVKSQTPITLSAVVGDKQSGGTAVLFNGQLVASGNPITNAPIGTAGQDLRGGEIECTTTVRDMNPLTNRTSVIYTLRGGQADRDYSYEVTVSEEGGRALYTISFVLQ